VDSDNNIEVKAKMKSHSLLFLRIAALALGISTIVACGGSDTPNANEPTVTPSNQPTATSSNANQQTSGVPTTTTANANQPAPPAGTANCGDCWVHVFDDKDFDATDDNHMICGPGKWPNLRNLTGAAKINWDNEIESLKVGPKATVIIWAEENYTGATQTFGPGTTIPSLKTNTPNLSDNASSIEIKCQ
jgi:hypothetical protein